METNKTIYRDLSVLVYFLIFLFINACAGDEDVVFDSTGGPTGGVQQDTGIPNLLMGDFNQDGAVDGDDSLALATYLFENGPAPACKAAAAHRPCLGAATRQARRARRAVGASLPRCSRDERQRRCASTGGRLVVLRMVLDRVWVRAGLSQCRHRYRLHRRWHHRRDDSRARRIGAFGARVRWLVPGRL